MVMVGAAPKAMRPLSAAIPMGCVTSVAVAVNSPSSDPRKTDADLVSRRERVKGPTVRELWQNRRAYSF